MVQGVRWYLWVFKRIGKWEEKEDVSDCISFLGLPQMGSNRNVRLTVLEAASPKSMCHQQDWFLMRVMREGSVPGLSPCLVDGCLLSVSLHIAFSLCMPVSKFPLFIKHPSFWIRNHPCDLLLTWLFPQIGSLGLGFCRRDTIQPITVTNF